MNKSIDAFIQALNVFAKHVGHTTGYFLDAHHDVIFACCDADFIPPDSEDGVALKSLGWHIDEDGGWAYFT